MTTQEERTQKIITGLLIANSVMSRLLKIQQDLQVMQADPAQEQVVNDRLDTELDQLLEQARLINTTIS